MATYPTATVSFSTKVDGVDLVQASHVNVIQNEIVALEDQLRISKLASLAAAPSGNQVLTSVAGSPVWADIIAGIIQMYGGAVAPVGYLLCDGASILRATYPALFTAIGTNFGTVDGTHFNVPDMRGVFPKGAGATNRAAGKDANGNYYAGALGAYVTDKMQGHKHSTAADWIAWGGFGSQYGGTGVYVSNKASFGDILVDSPTTDNTNGTPRTGLTTEPQSLGLTYIIKT